MHNFTSVHSHANVWYSRYVCSLLQHSSKGTGNSLQLICNAHTVFLIVGQIWRLDFCYQLCKLNSKSTYILPFYHTGAQKLNGRAPDSWSEGSEFKPCVPPPGLLLSVSLTNLLHSTQRYEWVLAWAGKVTGSLCRGLVTLPQQPF